MIKRIYIILAAMLLLCLAPMPYGYFMLVRFIMLVACGGLAYRYYMLNKKIAMWIFITLALLFQPIYKIVLGRIIWNAVDVIVAAFLIFLFFVERQLERKTEPVNRTLPDEKRPALDNKIRFRLGGKLEPTELLYVATEEDKKLTELIEKNPEIMEGWGQMIGFQIIYLPLLLKRLRKKEVLQYRAPYLSEDELEEVQIGNDFLLQYLEHDSDRDQIKHGFIRTDNVYKDDDGNAKVTNRFYPLSTNSSESIADQLHRIGKQIFEEQNQQGRYLESYDEWGEPDDNTGCVEGQEERSTDDLIEEVREHIAKLRQRGIAEYVLEQLIHPDNRLSRLVITKDYRIMLPDYNDMEIKMEPLVKAVYLLFLKHPEGILFKQLPDYREELTEIYVELKLNGMSEKTLQSIEDVTNPMLNSIHEKCARIRAAFVGRFDDYMAKSYYINGLRGEVKKIPLPRNMVTWE